MHTINDYELEYGLLIDDNLNLSLNHQFDGMRITYLGATQPVSHPTHPTRKGNHTSRKYKTNCIIEGRVDGFTIPFERLKHRTLDISVQDNWINIIEI